MRCEWLITYQGEFAELKVLSLTHVEAQERLMAIHTPRKKTVFVLRRLSLGAEFMLLLPGKPQVLQVSRSNEDPLKGNSKVRNCLANPLNAVETDRDIELDPRKQT